MHVYTFTLVGYATYNYLYDHPAGDKEVEGGFFCVPPRALGKAVSYFITLSFIGTPKRLIGTPPGPRRGEEEEERRRRRGGEEDTFHSQGLGTLRMASRRASHARTTRTRNTISRFPPSTSDKHLHNP